MRKKHNTHTRSKSDLVHHFSHTTFIRIITKPLDMQNQDRWQCIDVITKQTSGSFQWAEDGSYELGFLESCGPYRAESNVINVERQKHKRRPLLGCRAVVTVNLLWALSLSVQELAFFWSPTTWLLQVSFFRLIKQRRSGRSLWKFSRAKFQCSISPVSERRTKEGRKVLVFKPPKKDFACETFVIKDYEIRSWLWMSLNILWR